MTEKQKKIAIIAATVIVAIILLLSSKRASGNTIVNQQGVPDIQVTIPSMNIPDRSGLVINIPGLPSVDPYSFSPISPCMCNGAATQQSNVNPLNFTFVTNQGNAGPNVYNYYSPQPSTGLNMLYGSGG